jgi:hypothetical protein
MPKEIKPVKDVFRNMKDSFRAKRIHHFPLLPHTKVSSDAGEVKLRMIGCPGWNLTNIPSELAKAHQKILYTI